MVQSSEDAMNQSDEDLVADILEEAGEGTRLYVRKRTKPNVCRRCDKMLNKGDIAVYIVRDRNIAKVWTDFATAERDLRGLYYRMCTACYDDLRPLLPDKEVEGWIQFNTIYCREKEKEKREREAFKEALKEKERMTVKEQPETRIKKKEGPMERNIKLRMAILCSGKKQYEIAQECGITETRISRLVARGEEPTEKEVEALCRVLEMLRDKLFGEEGIER